METTYKHIQTISEFIDAIRLRVDVFIREQGFPAGWEPDVEDKESKHVIAITEGIIVGTARYREEPQGEFKIERMVTKKEYRKNHIGGGLVEYITKTLQRKKAKRIWLQSQVRSQKFYEKCGFVATSKAYDLYGCPHIDMEYKK